jgi:hypothetical protein
MEGMEEEVEEEEEEEEEEVGDDEEIIDLTAAGDMALEFRNWLRNSMESIC